jgi:hypothetical protein
MLDAIRLCPSKNRIAIVRSLRSIAMPRLKRSGNLTVQLPYSKSEQLTHTFSHQHNNFWHCLQLDTRMYYISFLNELLVIKNNREQLCATIEVKLPHEVANMVVGKMGEKLPITRIARTSPKTPELRASRSTVNTSR